MGQVERHIYVYHLGVVHNGGLELAGDGVNQHWNGRNAWGQRRNRRRLQCTPSAGRLDNQREGQRGKRREQKGRKESEEDCRQAAYSVVRRPSWQRVCELSQTSVHILPCSDVSHSSFEKPRQPLHRNLACWCRCISALESGGCAWHGNGQIAGRDRIAKWSWSGGIATRSLEHKRGCEPLFVISQSLHKLLKRPA
ncbi:hypothetical protein IQ07DRAFT_102761 [Pyrenochaeta sp. DS3sAY3a]|nr:hypothetical protein IQ07DRAFT_102761 [Pyrenochaeta sp. DS3sAY3a]